MRCSKVVALLVSILVSHVSAGPPLWHWLCPPIAMVECAVEHCTDTAAQSTNSVVGEAGRQAKDVLRFAHDNVVKKAIDEGKEAGLELIKQVDSKAKERLEQIETSATHVITHGSNEFQIVMDHAENKAERLMSIASDHIKQVTSHVIIEAEESAKRLMDHAGSVAQTTAKNIISNADDHVRGLILDGMTGFLDSTRSLTEQLKIQYVWNQEWFKGFIPSPRMFGYEGFRFRPFEVSFLDTSVPLEALRGGYKIECHFRHKRTGAIQKITYVGENVFYNQFQDAFRGAS